MVLNYIKKLQTSQVFWPTDILGIWRDGTINLFAGFFFRLDLRPADNSLAFDLRRAILRWNMCFKV
jgi:hypothetical protein